MNIELPILHSWLDFPENDDCIVLYTIGCVHNCTNCHNKKLQNGHNKLSNDDILDLIIKASIKYKTKNIVFSGGDPLYIENVLDVIYINKTLKNKNFYTCVYTGYELDDLNTFMMSFDYIKTGKYIEEKKQHTYKGEDKFQLASTNQKLYKYENGKYNLKSKDGIFKY